MSLSQRLRIPELTIFGRSLLLILLELFANALLWVIAGILFGRNDNTRPIMNLALLAWVRIPIFFVSFPAVAQRDPQTLGLRHGEGTQLSPTGSDASIIPQRWTPTTSGP